MARRSAPSGRADEGDGIPAAHLPRLTERFYRVDNARSRRLGGTGLGLAIAKHVVNRHRGRLDIRRTPGKGSVFTVTLPAAGTHQSNVRNDLTLRNGAKSGHVALSWPV